MSNTSAIDEVKECIRKKETVCWLNNKGITGEQIKEILDILKEHDTLETLDLRYNKLGDVGAKHVGEWMKENKTGKRIDLSNNDITKEGVKYIADGVLLIGIVDALRLVDNDIGDDGIKYLMNKLMKNKSSSLRILDHLDVSSNKIGDAGVEWISQYLMMDNCKLTKLYLYDNNIGNRGGLFLRDALKTKNTSLTYLNLNANNIDENIMNEIMWYVERNKRGEKIILISEKEEEEIKIEKEETQEREKKEEEVIMKKKEKDVVLVEKELAQKGENYDEDKMKEMRIHIEEELEKKYSKVLKEKEENFAKVLKEKEESIATLKDQNVELKKQNENEKKQREDEKKKNEMETKQKEEEKKKLEQVIAILQTEKKENVKRIKKLESMISGYLNGQNRGLKIDKSEVSIKDEDKPIGKSGQAKVFKGIWKKSSGTNDSVGKQSGKEEIPVAVKVMKIPMDPIQRGRILSRDVSMVRKLCPHGRIVEVYGYVEIDEKKGKIGIVMEMMSEDGSTLEEFVKKDGEKKLSKEDKMIATMQICGAVKAIHEKGVIHRDIKPKNFLISEDKKNFKISDFGVSKMITESTITNGQVISGTDRFLAPELIKEKKGSFASDIFALGITLYFLWSGKYPFEDFDAKFCIFKYFNGEKVVSDEDKQIIEDPFIIALIEKCINVDPKKRPTAEEVMKELDFLGFQFSKESNKYSSSSSSSSSSISSSFNLAEIVKCPLTKKVFVDPVYFPTTGVTYEREALDDAFNNASAPDPEGVEVDEFQKYGLFVCPLTKRKALVYENVQEDKSMLKLVELYYNSIAQ